MRKMNKDKLTTMYLLGSKACMVKCSMPEPILEKHLKNKVKKYNTILIKKSNSGSFQDE